MTVISITACSLACRVVGHLLRSSGAGLAFVFPRFAMSVLVPEALDRVCDRKLCCFCLSWAQFCTYSLSVLWARGLVGVCGATCNNTWYCFPCGATAVIPVATWGRSIGMLQCVASLPCIGFTGWRSQSALLSICRCGAPLSFSLRFFVAILMVLYRGCCILM